MSQQSNQVITTTCEPIINASEKMTGLMGGDLQSCIGTRSWRLVLSPRALLRYIPNPLPLMNKMKVPFPRSNNSCRNGLASSPPQDSRYKVAAEEEKPNWRVASQLEEILESKLSFGDSNSEKLACWWIEIHSAHTCMSRSPEPCKSDKVGYVNGIPSGFAVLTTMNSRFNLVP
jgi:hypothetical protein